VEPSNPSLRRRAVAREAERFGGVLSRTALRGLGADRHVIAREAAGDRWAIHGAQTVAVHTRPLEAPALWWRAVWESGSRVATLDGVSALLAAGVNGYNDPVVHVSVPDAHSPKRTPGVRVHRVVRLDGELLTDRGVPRVRPALAAVRAAHWAVSDRQAALVLVLPMQQGIVSGPQLQAATSMWSGRRRRALIPQLVQDITDGATSLGELDFARMCRERGLPQPDRQVVRRTPRGRVYLDVGWGRSRLVVEIDGSHHGEGLTVISDHLRQNEVALTRDIVLRISLLGLRLAEDPFLDQVARALRLANAA
jgi:very-short-patch-repair endonuclease